MYTDTIYGKTGETLESFIDACQKYLTGGVEGKIPLIAFLRKDSAGTPADLKAQVEYVRERGVDGFFIWRYGGPGTDDPTDELIDIVP